MNTHTLYFEVGGNLKIRLISLNNKGRLLRPEDLEGSTANLWARIHYFLIPICCYFYHTEHLIFSQSREQTFTSSLSYENVLHGNKAHIHSQDICGVFFPSECEVVLRVPFNKLLPKFRNL